MARLQRLSLAGYPHHCIQRGNNRQNIFYSDDDRRAYLSWLAMYSEKYEVEVHAYVLMDNHTHLLLRPTTDTGVPQMMQALGRRYAQSMNYFHKRTGTLWEGRYKSTLIDSDEYLLTCMAYIDLNPVRAGLCTHPSDYEWSSYRHYAGVRRNALLSTHPLLWTLGNTPFDREQAYQKLVNAGVSQIAQQRLTDSVLKGWALGGESFLGQLNTLTPRRTSKTKVGRPGLKSPIN